MFVLRKWIELEKVSNGVRSVSFASSYKRSLISIGCLSVAFTATGFYIIKYRILRDENFRTVTGASTVDRKKHFNTVQEKINENNTKDIKSAKKILDTVKDLYMDCI